MFFPRMIVSNLKNPAFENKDQPLFFFETGDTVYCMWFLSLPYHPALLCYVIYGASAVVKKHGTN